jgi:hypothetical protein
VHLDPIVVGDETVNHLRELAQSAARAVHCEFTIHDFRMTMGEQSFNMIFDLVIPTDCAISASEAERLVVEKIHQEKPNCFCVIKVEHPFV